MKDGPRSEVGDLLANPADTLKWIESQAPEQQESSAKTSFEQLLGDAARPKSVSGNACVRVCAFVEQASKSSSSSLQQWAFCQDVTLNLFNFYMEWNESDQHRSMKLVLDLVVQLLKRNPDKSQATSIGNYLLGDIVSIVIGRSTKPVAKSAIKTLDHFLTKGIFTLDDIKANYVSYRPDLGHSNYTEVWRLFIIDLFHWLHLHYVCSTAGKLVVTLYRFLRQKEQKGGSEGPTIEDWNQWLLDLVTEHPALLESVKCYIYLPLFTVDRTEALRFLRRMNEYKAVSKPDSQDLDASALLQLAALETGKKVGLVEEPDLGGDDDSSEENSTIILQEQILEGVLAHPSNEVRALALSLLITSPSTTRPYSATAFDLLRKHLATYYADPDAKFRVDVLSKGRDMFKRVRGAIFVLKRSIPRARAKAEKLRLAGRLPPAEAANIPQTITYRANLIALPEAQLTSCLEYHESFLRWYMLFLCGELAPTISYQRHIASLKGLMFILRMEAQSPKTWETEDDQELYYDSFDGKWVRALFDLVMDPFEDVRELAASALKMLLSDKRYRKFSLLSGELENRAAFEIDDLRRQADGLARRTARADHSDGAARASQLFYTILEAGDPRLQFLSTLVQELEQKISRAEEDLGRAVMDAPLHGDFASLGFVWRVVSDLKFSESELHAVEELQDRLVACCKRIWDAVRDILCDDSPEGHLPQDLEELDGLDTKDLLSYSFRAIHESSNLMRTIALTIKNKSNEGFIHPPQKLFEEIGNLTFNQLSSLRHRGAFSTVSLTFAACCQQSKHLKYAPGEPTILDVCYEGAMSEIFSQRSTTRRSAGIPSLMTGILSANAQQPSFDTVLEKLISIAGIEAHVTETDGSNLPQVHAYNCLKDIFKSSFLTSLGNKSEKYLPQCLELAASGLRSEVWAIRNCGLIFLRSLIDCLFGSHESKSMIEAGWDGKANRIAYHRYPNLPSVLMNLLKSGHQIITQKGAGASAAESVFPALDIIRRAGPPDLLRDELQIHIAKYLSSPVWHVREIAARTLCSCLLHERWLSVIEGIFQEALAETTANRNNHVHGVLLTLKFVFERFTDIDSERLTTRLPELSLFLEKCQIDQKYPTCPDVLAAYLEVINLIWAFQRSISQPLQPFSVSLPSTSGSALLKKQRIIYDVYSAFQRENQIEALESILFVKNIGADTLVAGLEVIPELWRPKETSDSILSALCVLYIDISLKIGLVEPQVSAIQNLADIMDHLLKQGKFDKLPASQLLELWAGLPLRPMNPALFNSIVRASGSILATLKHTHGIGAHEIQNWGAMVANAGHADQTFDTRFAAAQSLRSFFSAAENTFNSEEHIPALIALYDALNDDDDEVRGVGSEAAEAILGQPIVPIEAANRLLQWLGTNLKDSALFRDIVAKRIIGQYDAALDSRAWLSAGSQLTAALRVDDALFAVEEQNLFIDEVRETNRWIAVLDSLKWDNDDEVLVKLTGWVREGLSALRRLMEDQYDGPLGWASSPSVYAVSSSIILGSAALIKHQPATDIRNDVISIKEALKSGQNKVSPLLTEPWQDIQVIHS